MTTGKAPKLTVKVGTKTYTILPDGHVHSETPPVDPTAQIDAAIAAHVAAMHGTPPPDPEPEPEPEPPPLPGPVTYIDYRIPATIDDTGATDVYFKLGVWIAKNVPNGVDATHHSRILPNSATSKYLIVSENPDQNPDQTVTLQGGFQMKKRRHITIDGLGRWKSFPTFAPNAAGLAAYKAFDPYAAWTKGAQIIHRSPGLGGFSAWGFTEDSDDIRYTGWTVDGGDDKVGTVHIEPYENRSLCYIRFGSTNIEFDGNFADRGGAFAIICAADSGHTAAYPRGVKDHHNFVRGYETHPGVVSVDGYEAWNNIVKDCTGSAFDIEPERSGDVCINVTVRDSVYDTYSWGATRSCWLFSCVPGSPLVTMKGYKVYNLLIPRGPATAQNGNYPGQGGLSARIEQPDVTKYVEDVEFTNCYSADDQTMLVGGGRASIKANNVRNLRITGHTQKVTPGGAPFIYSPSTSNLVGTVVLDPNTTT